MIFNHNSSAENRLPNKLLYSASRAEWVLAITEDTTAYEFLTSYSKGSKNWNGVTLFNFEREFCIHKTRSLVASQAAKQSTEARQRDVFESHKHRAFSLAFYMTGNEMEAEDILTRTFVRAFQQDEQPDAFGVDSALIAELGERFTLNVEQPTAVGSLESTLVHRNVLRSDLEAAIRSLPANERLCFLLRDVEGYSPDAISKLLQVSPAQVQRSLFSARLRLRQELARVAVPTSEAA